MKKKFVFLFLLFFSGCFAVESNKRFSDTVIENAKISASKHVNAKSNDAIIIDVDNVFGNEPIDTDNLIDTIYFLTLETKEESVFDGISKLIIADNRIFIIDDNDDILIFDISGKFVSKLTRGQGPDEIIGACDFAFNIDSKQLIIYDESDCLKYFDINGKHITDQKVPLVFHEFCTTDDGFAFYQPHFLNKHLGEGARYAVLLSNRQMEFKLKGVSLIEHRILARTPYIMKDESKIMISPLANDTIFEVTSSNIMARYILKFENHKVDVSDVEIIKNSEKYYQCSGYIENSRTQIFNFYSYKKGSYLVLRDKKTGKTIGGQLITCSWKFIPPCYPAKCVYNDYFVTTIQPMQGMRFTSNIISEIDNKKLEKLTDEDNVVLVFYKFKEIK